MIDTDRPVIVETVIAAPLDAVWRALRDPAEIRRWHGWEYDGLDEEIEAIYVDNAVPSEADRTIDIPGDNARFALEARGGETVVRVTRAAPAGDAPWDEFQEVREGWITFVQQLRFALERHPGADRRTLTFKGEGGDPLTPGVIGLSDARPGERFAGTTPWGERLTGEVLYRDDRQVGLTVDEYGDGLIVLHTYPRGGGRAIVTTYGLDDAALSAVRDRWASWWSEHYAPPA